jgi:hypothetical protein
MKTSEGFRPTYICLRAHGDSLRALPKGILHVDIVQLEVARPDPQRRSEIVARLRFLALGTMVTWFEAYLESSLV